MINGKHLIFNNYFIVPVDFEYLKEASIDLGEARLTDKQLMAVCMVFYGGVKKKRAAQAMNITSQALSDHVKAALKKIGDDLARF
jgi:predicted DNA-binding protein (UPF0251 family)